MRRLLHIAVRLVAALLLIVVLLLVPIAYIELFCQGGENQRDYEPEIADLEFQRPEANSFLTYPEWHIVYAYQGLAETLKSGDEYRFGYLSSISGFWSSACALNRKAGEHGAGDFNTRATIHVIGVSFTIEMLMKAVYEETLGRLFAILRGGEKSPQDRYAAAMAEDYGKFLEQTPWYKYDFRKSIAELWAQPLSMPVRGWERRLALGGEWKAKAAYAGVIANAVAASGQAQLRIRTVVTGMLPSELAAMDEVHVIDTTPRYVIIETPRYSAFTRILQEIARAGGNVTEIAGNDDIMVTAISTDDAREFPIGAALITSVARDGFPGRRLLIEARVTVLADLLRSFEQGPVRLEHVYDY